MPSKEAASCQASVLSNRRIATTSPSDLSTGHGSRRRLTFVQKGARVDSVRFKDVGPADPTEPLLLAVVWKAL